MIRWVRRLMRLSALVGVGFGVYRWWSERQTASPTPEWPPMPVVRKAPTDAPPAPAAADARWLPAVDGACPVGYPLKANDSSRIFHVAGGRFYDRTVADRCYAQAEDAIADGYRQAKA